MNNNPILYRDPSGHVGCADIPAGSCARQQCEQSNAAMELWNNPAKFDETFGITFTGEWRADHRTAVRRAVWAVAHALAGPMGKSPAEAFQAVYGGVTFQWGNCPECNGGGAFTASPHQIKFASMAADWHPDRALRWRNLVVHELGHAFNQKFYKKGQPSPVDALRNTQASEKDFPDRQDYPAHRVRSWTGPNSGFASPQNVLVWQMAVNQAGSPSEEFADMFLGWTFGAWEDSAEGQARAYWMTTHMPDFLRQMP